MTAALLGPFIPAAGYRQGRAFAEAKSVSWLQVHTAEGSTEEIGLGNFFRGTRDGSSHAGAGQGGGYAGYVPYTDTAWTGPPINEESDTLEVCGFARWSREEWLAHGPMLETVAKWLAWRAAVRQLPLLKRSTADLLNGLPGVTGHVDITNAWHQSDHQDPGGNFPYDTVLARARTLAGLNPAPVAAPVLYFNGGKPHAGHPYPWDGHPVKAWCPQGTTLRPGARGDAVSQLERALGLAPTGFWGYDALTTAVLNRKHGLGFATSTAAPLALRQGRPEAGWEFCACL